MRRYTIEIANLHCESCENDISQTVAELLPHASVTFDLPHKSVKLAVDEHSSSGNVSIKDIVLKLYSRGFEVTAVDGTPLKQSEPKPWFLHPLRLLSSKKQRSKSQSHAQHLEICSECQSNAHAVTPAADNQDDGNGQAAKFRAVYSIKGMTCSSCSQSIKAAIAAAVPSATDVQVDVITGAAWMLLPNKTLAKQVTEAIFNAGFDPLLTEMLPVANDTGMINVRASIGGMTCGSCAATVKRATSSLPFVSEAAVDAVSGSAQFTISDPDRLAELRDTVEDLGYTYEQVGRPEPVQSTRSKARTISLKVSGIYCDNCPVRVMHTLQSFGEAVEIVDPLTRDSPYIKFTYIPTPPQFTIRSILATLRRENAELSFHIVQPKTLEELAAEHLAQEHAAIWYRLVFTSIVAFPAALMMLGVMLPGNGDFDMFVLSTPVYLFAADMFHLKALAEVKGLFGQTESNHSWTWRAFHFGSMNLLMSLGTSISYWASVWLLVTHQGETYFDSVIFLTLFLLIGRYLDVYSKAQTSMAVSHMSKLRPETVELFYNNTLETVWVYAVEIGDVVAVVPGHKCAVDGVVTRGESEMNESMLTGESLPVAKKPGDQAFAGSVNVGSQRLIIKVGAVTKGTLLDDIVESVREGQFKSAPIEHYVEKVTSVFVPLVLYLALLVWLIWYIVGRAGWLPHEHVRNWAIWSMNFAIATFVIACPCGIGLAAPTALYVGNGLAAKYGILARGGGEAFQEGSQIDAVCFDKTGTLTKGAGLEIADVWCLKDSEKTKYLRLAAALEAESVHPLATAVRNFAPSGSDEVSDSIQADITQISKRGRGVSAKVEQSNSSYTALLGNERLITDHGGITIPTEVQNRIDRYKSEGKSVMVLAVEGKVVLVLSAADEIRPEAQHTISVLQAAGIACFMISGDNLRTAQAVAAEVGIPVDNVLAEVLPEEKADRVRYLQRTANTVKSSYGRAVVAMVGDGVNDAPALAASDVGIALGRGADIALSSSQFVLLREDLRALIILVQLSRAVMRRVKFNFFWAGIYNVVAIPVAAGAFYPWTHTRLSPVWASLAMALSSVSVMLGSLMLRRFHPKDA